MNPRSWLFIPADSDKKLGKSDATGADALIFDLEDSVAPERKAMARDMLRDHLLARPPGQRPAQFYVRINPLDDSALGDLAAIMPGRPDGIMLPKTFGAACVQRLSFYLDAFEAMQGIAPGLTRIIPVATETARGAMTLAEFADRPLPRLSALTWGAEDLATVLGASTNLALDGGWALTYRIARSNLLLAAKAAGVAAIDTLYVDFRDDAGLVLSCEAAAAEGFEGRIAIHPAQVVGINAGFSPSAAAIRHAERVLAAFAAAPGAGTVGLDGKMLDIPHLKQARAVLARRDVVSPPKKPRPAGAPPMKRADKVIISCAITGSIHTPSMSPHLPVTAESIAEQAIAATQAGAAIVHLHAREEGSGKPTQSIAEYEKFLPVIRDGCDAIINITTGAGLGMSMDERLAAANHFKPEIASMNMGSFNFNISGAARRGTFARDWEKPYLEKTTDFILSNTFSQIERALTELNAHATRFEFECYDVGHLYNLAHFADRGLVKPPFFVQSIFGILGGIGPDPENLMHMKATADRLFGNDYYLSILAAGRHQFPLVTMGAILGANVRVGLEDNLYLGRGEMAPSNAAQVAKIRHILEELSLQIATPDEARQMLDTKGAANVGF